MIFSFLYTIIYKETNETLNILISSAQSCNWIGLTKASNFIILPYYDEIYVFLSLSFILFPSKCTLRYQDHHSQMRQLYLYLII